MLKTGSKANSREPLRAPLPHGTAVKKFHVTFCRPDEAIPVTPEERADQLRRVLSQCVKVSALYIPVEVSICSGKCEEFCIAFTTNGEQPMADELIRQRVKPLDAKSIRLSICEKTGIWPRFLIVEEIPLDDIQVITLTAQEQAVFAEALLNLNPPPPGQRLRAAARHYREVMGQ